MKNTPIRLGLLALLLTIISICMAVLAMLSVSSSHADLRLSERFAQSVKTRYELEEEGQLFLKQMNESPKDEIISKDIEKDGFVLSIELQLKDDEYIISNPNSDKIMTLNNNVLSIFFIDITINIYFVIICNSTSYHFYIFYIRSTNICFISIKEIKV